MHAGVVTLAKAAKEDFIEAFKLYFGPLAKFLQLCKQPVYRVLPLGVPSLAVWKLPSPPGWKLRSFAELCFSEKTFAQIEPVLSDMQEEHFEALAAGRLWQARMALVRGYWSFWSAVLAQLSISFARRVYEVWKATKG